MIIAAFCPSCAEERARSRDVSPGTRPQAADFTPIDGQDPPVDGTPATCTACQSPLVFRRIGQDHTNGHASPAPPRQDPPGITTLFAVSQGEEVRETRQLGPDTLVIFTNRRIVKINLIELLEAP